MNADLGRGKATKATKATKARNTPKQPITPRRRCKPGTRALREIRKYQKSTDHVIQLTRVDRWVREIAQAYGQDIKFSAAAMGCFREALEQWCVYLLENANRCCIHRKCVTLQSKDVILTLKILGDPYQTFDTVE